MCQSRRIATTILFALALAAAALGGDERPVRLRVGPARSKLTFRAFRDGWFSSLGHDHMMAARRFEGAILWTGRPETSTVTLTVATASLEVLDPEASAKDRADIAENLTGTSVLDVAHHPEIRFRSTGVKDRAPANEALRLLEVTGELELHGVKRTIRFEVALDPKKVRAKGAIALDQSDYGIKPFGVGLGAVRVKDRVELEFEVEGER